MAITKSECAVLKGTTLQELQDAVNGQLAIWGEQTPKLKLAKDASYPAYDPDVEGGPFLFILEGVNSGKLQTVTFTTDETRYHFGDNGGILMPNGLKAALSVGGIQYFYGSKNISR